jgi:hypothetical protein
MNKKWNIFNELEMRLQERIIKGTYFYDDITTPIYTQN